MTAPSFDQLPTPNTPPRTEFLNGAYDRPELPAAVALGFFCYQDALLEPNLKAHAMNHLLTASPNAVGYAMELQDMFAEMGGDKVLELAQLMRDAGVSLTRAVGIEPSPYAHSVTWSLWDMAKQRFWARQHREGAVGEDYPYRGIVGDALTDPKVRLAVIYRHVGWEIDSVRRDIHRQHLAILGEPGTDVMSDILRTGRRNGQQRELNSLDLTRLGQQATMVARKAAPRVAERYHQARRTNASRHIADYTVGPAPSDLRNFNRAELKSLRRADENAPRVTAIIESIRSWQ